MRTILLLIIILAILMGAIMALDYFGFIIEIKNPLIALAIGAPVLQAIIQFFNRPEKNFFKNK